MTQPAQGVQSDILLINLVKCLYMVEFKRKEDRLLVLYSPMNPWVANVLERDGEVTLRKAFTFTDSDLDSRDFGENEEEIHFVLGRLEGNYFKIASRILGIEQLVYLHKEIVPSESLFITMHGVSIFKKIGEILEKDIYIGGDEPGALPESELLRLIKEFPGPYELKKYVESRLGAVLGNYFESASTLQEKYEKYMNKRQSKKGEDLFEMFRESELVKYELLLEKLRRMLGTQDAYNERQWQKEILQILLLLYPKYIRVFDAVTVRDTYAAKNRQLDFLLVDSNGNVDIVEIKRPFEEKIITPGKYRDNHIPMRELSGTVMQIEKYIFYLNKWGKKGEEELTSRFQASLPKDLNIHVTNPSGIIIIGRDVGLSKSQKEDFEVVKRKYKNVMDIITYDDLLRRLEAIIGALKKH